MSTAFITGAMPAAEQQHASGSVMPKWNASWRSANPSRLAAHALSISGVVAAVSR